MNPELQRNLWLTITPRRLVLDGLLIAVVLLLSVGLPAGLREGRMLDHARYLYLFFAVLLASRDAAVCIVAEIRDRTWDQQRLSALGAWSMLWGKLVGATASRWLAALICLAAIVAVSPRDTALRLHELVLIALVAQVAALLASLIGIRRRAARSRMEAYLYQGVGLAAAVGFMLQWPSTYTDEWSIWWGWRIGIFWLATASAVAAIGWAIVGCHRLLRRELLMQNAPYVWLGFLAFVAVYAAGWEIESNRAAFRLLLATASLAAVTYVAIVLDAHDAVHYRRVAALWRAGATGDAMRLLPTWVTAFAATAIGWMALLVAIATTPEPIDGIDRGATLAAALGFLARDCALLLLLQFRLRRGAEAAGLFLLFVAYWVLPTLALQLGAVTWPFWPMVSDAAAGIGSQSAPGYAAVAAGWVQAALFMWLALRALRRPASAAPAS
ncbi:MAG: hypothetical protein AB7F67_24215 [Rhodospirillaceae bacterium]